MNIQHMTPIWFSSLSTMCRYLHCRTLYILVSYVCCWLCCCCACLAYLWYRKLNRTIDEIENCLCMVNTGKHYTSQLVSCMWRIHHNFSLHLHVLVGVCMSNVNIGCIDVWQIFADIFYYVTCFFSSSSYM